MYDNVITLISETNEGTDEYGDRISRTSDRVVFADLRSIGQSEFYQAKTVGLKPEIKFVLADFLEYRGEKTLKYQPFDGEEEVYTIIRTYRANNELELVCKRGVDDGCSEVGNQI